VKRCVLNVGGGSKEIPIPARYEGWDHILLDIDATHDPDVVCDARELSLLPEGIYDAVYCSHNLEHYWRHDMPLVLSGFVHVLAPEGFAEIAVPDLKAVFDEMQARNLDIDDVLYESNAGPITPNDVIYGWGQQIAASGNDFYAHKNCFTPTSLTRALAKAGFMWVYVGRGPYELRAFAFKREPEPAQRDLLQLPPPRGKP
jgi:hypothetical protein